MTDAERVQLEEAGFEAVQRLYASAIDPENELGGVVARFLLGLYNGARFPFDLTDLRLLDDEPFDDCMTVLRMDARLTRKEVHSYFDQGGVKFERLVADWNVVDVERLKHAAGGAPEPARRGLLRHGDQVAARLVTSGEAPGYRDVSLTLDCEVAGEDRQVVGPVRLDVQLGPEDGEAVMRQILGVHRLAWRDGRTPLDARPGEKRPDWLDKP